MPLILRFPIPILELKSIKNLILCTTNILILTSSFKWSSWLQCSAKPKYYRFPTWSWPTFSNSPAICNAVAISYWTSPYSKSRLVFLWLSNQITPKRFKNNLTGHRRSLLKNIADVSYSTVRIKAIPLGRLCVSSSTGEPDVFAKAICKYMFD